MPTITQLEYIVAVAKTKHFGRAAKECNVSQPSLSAQIQKAEEEFQTLLFDRSKSPLLITTKGKLIIEQSKVILREHKKLFSLAQLEEFTLQGNFHLGVIPTLSSSLIPLFIESFAKKYPNIKLSISEFETKELVEKLHEDELDGGLLITPLHDPRLIERRLFLEPFFVFLAPSHPMENDDSVSEKDLEKWSFWRLKEGHCFRDQMMNLCQGHGGRLVFDSIQFEGGSLETIINLVRKGGKDTFTLLPQLATQSLMPREIEKQLKPFRAPVPVREVGLVNARAFNKERILQVLEETILNSVPKELKKFSEGNAFIVPLKS
jgi:LysR family hydrogen peroxide-inducible transcriptional activator